MKRVKKVVKWVFSLANNGLGAEMIKDRSYKIVTSAGTFWGRLVDKASNSVTLLGRDGKKRTAPLDRTSSVFRIKGEDEK